MGKGAGAGMIAATTRAVIRSARNNGDPATALALTQDCLATDLSQAGSFATLFHARLRASDGRILFSDAGHGLTLVVRAAGTWERLTSDNFPVGLLPGTRWESLETRLGPGDMIVSFSDGVLDLYDGTLAAVDEIGKLAASAGSAEELVAAVRRRAQGTANPDDVTILAVRRETHGEALLGPARRRTDGADRGQLRCLALAGVAELGRLVDRGAAGHRRNVQPDRCDALRNDGLAAQDPHTAVAGPADATVDVFITTYNEPLDMVMTTALAAKKIRHPHSTWILDDGDRPELRDLAAAHGLGYVTRSAEWSGMPRHAKAGNLNNALMMTSGEFLLILDADQIPEPDILDKTLGYFNNRRVALVQTPQYFSNVPADDPLGSQAPLFYGPIQQGKDGWNAAFFCGSNAVLRREALMQLGLVGYVKETEKSIRRALSASQAAIRKARKAASSESVPPAADPRRSRSGNPGGPPPARRRRVPQRDHLPGAPAGGPGRPVAGAGRCVRPAGRPGGDRGDVPGGGRRRRRARGDR